MPETLAGIERIMLFRLEDEPGNAWKIAFQTEHESSETRGFDSEQTKDGSVSSAGAYEATFSVSSYMTKGDEYIKKLKQNLRSNNPKKVLVWDLETADADEDGLTVPGELGYCNLTDITTTAGAEGNVEVSMDFSVDGTLIAGEVDVTPELLDIIRRIDEEREFVQPTGVAGA